MIRGINEILNENAALVAEIGEDKVFPLLAPHETGPKFITTSLRSGGPLNQTKVVSTADFPVFNVNIHTKNYDDIEDIAVLVRDALDLPGGATTTAGPYVFGRIWYITETDREDLYFNNYPEYVRTLQFGCVVRRPKN